MGSLPPELSLDGRRPAFLPKTISDFMAEIARIGSLSERLVRLDEFVKRLEEELSKVDAFKRDLPLSILLLNEAISTLKNEATECEKRKVELQFMPTTKRKCEDEQEEEGEGEEEDEDEEEEEEEEKEESEGDKMKWMSSVQLWTSDNDHSKADAQPEQESRAQVLKGAVEERVHLADDPFKSYENSSWRGAFMPFHRSPALPSLAKPEEQREGGGLAVAGPSFLAPTTMNLKDDFKTSFANSVSSFALGGPLNLLARPQPLPLSHQQQATSRKPRRCWSPELHRRFVNALQQLGGSEVATPKQIRELMHADGLTNDEVKSHLQKYRLHTRRIPSATTSAANGTRIRFGDLWIVEHDQGGEPPKRRRSPSGSPDGPLLSDVNGGAIPSTARNSSNEVEDDDGKSDSRCIHHEFCR